VYDRDQQRAVPLPGLQAPFLPICWQTIPVHIQRAHGVGIGGVLDRFNRDWRWLLHAAQSWTLREPRQCDGRRCRHNVLVVQDDVQQRTVNRRLTLRIGRARE
jgi:hypothetical protein